MYKQRHLPSALQGRLSVIFIAGALVTFFHSNADRATKTKGLIGWLHIEVGGNKPYASVSA